MQVPSPGRHTKRRFSRVITEMAGIVNATSRKTVYVHASTVGEKGGLGEKRDRDKYSFYWKRFQFDATGFSGEGRTRLVEKSLS